MASANLRGSSSSGGGGLRIVSTAQKRQPRVQAFPATMKVAVPLPQQS